MSEINDEFVETLCEVTSGGIDQNEPNAIAVAPFELPEPEKYLQGIELSKVRNRAEAKKKTYETPLPEMRKTLEFHPRLPLDKLSHADFKEVVLACACNNFRSVHWGSASDAFWSAIANQLLKFPFRYIVPLVDAHLPLQDASGLFNSHEIKGASKALQQPILGANRMISRAVCKPFHNFGVNGRGVSPGAQGTQHAALIVQLEKAVSDINAVVADRFENLARCESDSSANNEWLLRLRDELAAQIAQELQKNLQYLKVMAFDDRLATQAIMTVATISVQMISRIAAGVLLAPVGLAPLVKLVAPIVSVLVAPLTQATMNWQDTKSVGRAILIKYRELEKDFGTVPDEELNKLSQFAQDHFQSAPQANYWRLLENVVAPTIRKLGLKLTEARYEKEELTRRAQARTEAELAKIEEILGYQRELNAVDRSFSPKNYLTNAQKAVDELIEWSAAEEAGLTKEEFEKLLHLRAFEILTVEASPSHEDAERIKTLLKVDANRFGRTKPRNLGPIYQKKEDSMTAAAAPYAPKPLGSYSLAVATPRTAQYDELNEPLMYLQRNRKILKDRSERDDSIKKASGELTAMTRARAPGVMQSFQPKMDEAAEKAKKAQAKYLRAEKKYRRYLEDVRLFQQDEFEKMDANGKFVEQLLKNTSGFRVVTSNLFKRDLWDACKANIFKDIGLPFGESLAFNAIDSSIKKTNGPSAGSLLSALNKAKPIDGGTYESVMTPETYSALEKKVLRHVGDASNSDASKALSRSTRAAGAASQTQEAQADQIAVDNLNEEQLVDRSKRITHDSVKKIADFRTTQRALQDKLKQIDDDKSKVESLRTKVEAGKKRIIDATRERNELNKYWPGNWATREKLKTEIEALQNAEKSDSLVIAEYDAWVEELPSLQKAARVASDALSPVENFIVEIENERGFRGGSHNLSGLTALANKLLAVPVNHRYEAFGLLCACETDQSLRSSVLTMLAGKIDCLAQADRDAAHQSLITLMKPLSSAEKLPVLEKLIWNFSQLTEGKRKAFLVSLLDVGTLNGRDTVTHLNKLLGELWQLPAADRSFTLGEIMKRARDLADPLKAQVIARTVETIPMWSVVDHYVVFTSLLEETKKLAAADRTVALDALIKHLHKLPMEKRVEAFESLHSAVRNVTMTKLAPVEIWGDADTRGLFDAGFKQELKHIDVKAEFKVEILERNDGGSYLKNLLDEASSLPQSHRYTVFERSCRIGSETTGQESIYAFAAAASQIGGLFEADRDREFSNLLGIWRSKGPENQIDLLARNLSHFPLEYRLRVLEATVDAGLKLSTAQTADIAHALVLQLDFLPSKDLPHAFGKILGMVERLPLEQLKTPEILELFMNMSIGLRRASLGDIAKIEGDWAAFRSRTGYVRLTNAQQQPADVQKKTISENIWDGPRLVLAPCEFDAMLKPAGFVKSPMITNGPYKYFATLSSGANDRFKNTVSTYFSGLMAPQSSDEFIVAPPESQTIFVKQVFIGPSLPSDKIVVTKPPATVAGKPALAGESNSKPGAGQSAGAALKSDTDVPPILPGNIPRYVSWTSTSPPEEVLATGIVPSGMDESTGQHLSGTSTGSAYVSFTRDLEKVAVPISKDETGGIPKKRGYRYILKCPDKSSGNYSNWYDVQYAYPSANSGTDIAVRGPSCGMDRANRRDRSGPNESDEFSYRRFVPCSSAP